MKTRNFKFSLLLVIAVVFTTFSTSVFGQVPEKMSYQAVVRNASNELIVNKQIGVFVAIQKTTSGSSPMTYYQEKHVASTNANGLLTLELGGGTPSYPYHALSFSHIPWGEGSFYVKIMIDPTGGTNYTINTESQLLSVPYAMYAKKAGDIIEKDPLFGSSAANSIAKTDISNWNLAYSWGNHTGLYLSKNWLPDWTEIKNKPIGTSVGDMLYWENSQWNILPIGEDGQSLIISKGKPSWKYFISNIILPSVQTGSVSSITYFSAIIQGFVIADGGGAIADRGICYDTLPNPTTKSVVSAGSGLGSYSVNLSNLKYNTTYYLKAYATNSSGTIYGNEISFKTSTLIIGQDFQGGILAYLFQPNDHGYVNNELHGLIAAPTDEINGKWGCEDSKVYGTQTTIGSGLSNTQKIINQCSTSGIAARLCDNLNLNGYADWYLPSKDELSKVGENRLLISIMPYYSSSEGDAIKAYAFRFNSDGSIYSESLMPKSTPLYVRAIRSF